MRFRLSLTCVSLLICALPVFGQQALPGSAKNTQRCLKYPTLPPQLRVVQGLKNQACKPVSVVTEQTRKDLKPFEDEATYISFDLPGSLWGISADNTVVGQYSATPTIFSTAGFATRTAPRHPSMFPRPRIPLCSTSMMRT